MFVFEFNFINEGRSIHKIEELVAINACSDGIIVDLTPPTKGRLWIGTNPGISYQVIFLDKSNLLCYLLVVKMFNVHLKKVHTHSIPCTMDQFIGFEFFIHKFIS
jgi:hypothetical protein